MTLLALNAVLPQHLRPRYQLAIAALPIGLMFLSFVPTIVFAIWLSQLIAGWVWLVVLLAVMVVLMLSGYALGWVLNALFARFVFGWPPDQVRAVFVHSDVPQQWLKAGLTLPEGQSAQDLVAVRWQEERSVGVFRFVLKRGVLLWGAPMFAGMYVAPVVLGTRSLTLSGAIGAAALWSIAGAVFGAAMWYWSERSLRRSRQGREA